MKKEELKRILFPTLIIIFSFISIYHNISLIYTSTTRVTDENIFKTHNKNVLVIAVFPNGASERAGMKVGDIITRINGENFANANEADRILRASVASSVMRYDIIRDGKSITLYVTAAKQKIRFYQISNILFLFVTSFFCIFLVLKKKNSLAVFVFSLTILFSVTFVVVIMIQSFSGQATSTKILLTVLSTFMPVLSVHSTAYIARIKNLTKREKILVRINYLLAFVVILLIMYSFIVSSFTLINLGLVSLFLFSLLSNIILIFFRKNENRINRIIFLITKIVLYAAASLSITLSHRAFLSLLLLLLLYSFIVVIYYVVVKYRYFFLDIIVKRNLEYHVIFNSYIVIIIIMSLSALAYLSSIDLGGYEFRLTPTGLEIDDQSPEGFTERPFFLLCGILFILLVHRLNRYFRQWLNRKYEREEYNYREALSELSGTMASKIHLKDLYQSITQDLLRFLHVKGVALLLLEDSKYSLRSIQGFTKTFQKGISKVEVPEGALRLRKSSVYDKKKLINSELSKHVYAFVPLLIKEKQIALFLLGEKKSEVAFNQSDFDFVESIATQCAISIENKRLSEIARETERIKQELNLAKKIQLGLMPQESPQIADVDITGFYKSAKEVGGDYYDFFFTRNEERVSKITFVLGDVSGKGISASLYMSRFQGIMSSLFYSEHYSPRNLLIHTNNAVNRDIEKKSFVTCICAEYDLSKREMKISRAGHLPLIHYQSKTGNVYEIKSDGIGLGLVKTKLFENALDEVSVKAESGDIFLLYSDGITEAMNANDDEYGFDRIKRLLLREKSKSSNEISKSLNMEIENFTSSEHLQDDITLIVIKLP